MLDKAIVTRQGTLSGLASPTPTPKLVPKPLTITLTPLQSDLDYHQDPIVWLCATFLPNFVLKNQCSFFVIVLTNKVDENITFLAVNNNAMQNATLRTCRFCLMLGIKDLGLGVWVRLRFICSYLPCTRRKYTAIGSFFAVCIAHAHGK